MHYNLPIDNLIFAILRQALVDIEDGRYLTTKVNARNWIRVLSIGTERLQTIVDSYFDELASSDDA